MKQFLDPSFTKYFVFHDTHSFNTYLKIVNLYPPAQTGKICFSNKAQPLNHFSIKHLTLIFLQTYSLLRRRNARFGSAGRVVGNEETLQRSVSLLSKRFGNNFNCSSLFLHLIGSWCYLDGSSYYIRILYEAS